MIHQITWGIYILAGILLLPTPFRQYAIVKKKGGELSIPFLFHGMASLGICVFAPWTTSMLIGQDNPNYVWPNLWCAICLFTIGAVSAYTYFVKKS